MAQHGIRESGLYQLIHLQGSGAPHTENPDWSSEPLRGERLEISAFNRTFAREFWATGGTFMTVYLNSPRRRCWL